MSAFIVVLALLLTFFSVTHADCVLLNISLPDACLSIQSAYIHKSNTMYIFRGELDNSIYKWDMSNSPGFITIGTAPVTSFYSWANSVAVIDNLVYFVGTDAVAFEADPYSIPVHIFDTDTDSWIDSNTIEVPSDGAADGCVTHNETHLFLVGSYNEERSDILQIYDIANNQWESSMMGISNIDRKVYYGQYCWMADNVLYVFGGAVGSKGVHVDYIYKWTQSTGWSDIGSLSENLAYGKAIKHPSDNNIWLIGGQTKVNWKSETVDTILQFNITTETVEKYDYTMNYPRYRLAAEFIDNDLYIFGGGEFQNARESIEICYDIVTVPEDITTTSTRMTIEPTSIATTSITTSDINTIHALTTTTIPTDINTIPTAETNTITAETMSLLTTTTINGTPLNTPTSTDTMSTRLRTIFSTFIMTYDTEDDGMHNIDGSNVSESITGKEVLIVLIIVGGICVVIMGVLVCALYRNYEKRLRKNVVRNMHGHRDMSSGLKPIVGAASDAKPAIVSGNAQDEEALVTWFVYGVKLPQYSEMFASKGYDDLLMIEQIERKEQLIDIGVDNKQHQQKILDAIIKLREGSNRLGLELASGNKACVHDREIAREGTPGNIEEKSEHDMEYADNVGNIDHDVAEEETDDDYDDDDDEEEVVIVMGATKGGFVGITKGELHEDEAHHDDDYVFDNVDDMDEVVDDVANEAEIENAQYEIACDEGYDEEPNIMGFVSDVAIPQSVPLVGDDIDVQYEEQVNKKEELIIKY